MRLIAHSQAFAILRLPPTAPIPDWAPQLGFVSVTRTEAELSLICPEASLPEGMVAERGFRLFAVEGPLDFDQIGVLASLLGPLAAAHVPVLAVSTYDTDYLLLRHGQAARAEAALRRAGHEMVSEGAEE